MVVKPDRVRTTLWFASIVAVGFFLFGYNHIFPQFREIRRLEVNEHESRKELWIQTAVNASIDGEYNGQGLRNLCANAKWTPGLVVSCTGLDGGFGNVRNIALNCIRYSIELGAAFIIPQITSRNKNELADTKGGKIIPFNSFFDKEWFMTAMAQDCPQMKIYDSLDSVWDIPSLAEPLKVDPTSLVPTLKYEYMIPEFKGWRRAFDQWLTKELKNSKYDVTNHRLSIATPLRINIDNPLFTIPTYYDPPEFRHHFGRILQIRPDLRRLAAQILLNLSDRYNITIDPTQGIMKGKYLGAHLRTDEDVEEAGWRSYDFQKDHYIKQAMTKNIKLMYIASGDAQATSKLRSLAVAEFGISVVTKDDLLKGVDNAKLQGLSWDEQGLVDYEVMLKSSNFGGIDQSSFAWNLALRRQLVSGGDIEHALNSSDPNALWTFVDDLSIIYGQVGSWRLFADAMWP